MDQDSMEATRRDALMLGAGGLLALAPFEAPAFAMTGDMAGLPWANNAMRWAQVAFTEEDPPRYDPNFWFDLFKKTHVEAVCLSAGGCIASIPPKCRCITAPAIWATATCSARWSRARAP